MQSIINLAEQSWRATAEADRSRPKSRSRSRSKQFGWPIQTFGTRRQAQKGGRWHPRVTIS